MKKFTILSILILCISFQNINALEKKSLEDDTWNMIRERLFDGTNPKAFRFEEDIRIQLTGKVTKQDSAIVNELIIQLTDLIEIVSVQLVNQGGNFIININTDNRNSTKVTTPMYNISKVELSISSNYPAYNEKKRKFIKYTIISNLTKTFEPIFGKSNFGFFDTYSFEEARRFTEIDKNLIRKLYSSDFYKQLRKNTSKKFGYLFYLNLRFEGWVKRISMSIAILLTIIGFLYLLSLEKKLTIEVGFWKFFKTRFLILIVISIIYFFYKLPYLIPFFQFEFIFSYKLGYFLGNFIEVLIYGSISIVVIYFFDRYFLTKTPNFFQKQIYIFFSTLTIVLFVYFIVSLPFVYLNSSATSIKMSYIDHVKLTIIYDILILAFLRVLFNFIKYRMESMVNKKDVELARMKELKNQAELNALHSRINPHFLYNSLNSIAGLAHSDADKTEKMATSLSSLFRYSINKDEKTYSTVNEELDMVEKYLEVEKVRFGEKLDFTIEANENIQNKDIPKFLIQPLVENALKHGLSKITEVGKLIVKVFQQDKDLVIQVFDNGPDFPDEPVKGYGLQNLHDKLQILYGDEANLNWQNGRNKNIQITLKNQF